PTWFTSSIPAVAIDGTTADIFKGGLGIADPISTMAVGKAGGRVFPFVTPEVAAEAIRRAARNGFACIAGFVSAETILRASGRIFDMTKALSIPATHLGTVKEV